MSLPKRLNDRHMTQSRNEIIQRRKELEKEQKRLQLKHDIESRQLSSLWKLLAVDCDHPEVTDWGEDKKCMDCGDLR